MRLPSAALAAATLAAALALVPVASAHGVEKGDQEWIVDNPGPQIGPFLYLGAKHMVTGYDHLLFLVGVIFFLHRTKDVLVYVSMFTLGHSATLLFGVLADVHVNAFLVDAVIGLSVVYKGFDNLGGFRRLFGRQPDTKAAVLVFGLFHGFGLATKLQEFELGRDGLVENILSFNLGVEIGQFLALGAILLFMTWWRARESFAKHAFATNTLLMAGGFVLFGYQIAGYLVS
ncbi:MAG TPA: HupE/UreJ family protein [Candidatus Thermoplasmatota archaeon]|nr:HupE/UreJ family protein [Candidatus Thermoplasmatota archaeon]